MDEKYQDWLRMSKNIEPILRFPEFKKNGSWDFVGGNKLFEPITNKDHNGDLPILAITQERGAVPRDLIDYTVIATDKSVQSYKIVEIGDFIISLRSFQGGIEYSNYKGICSPAYIILRKKEDVESHFYRHYFKSAQYIKNLNKNIEGIRDGKMVSYDQFSKIQIPLPKKNEQKKIADCLSSLDDLITSQNDKVDALKNYKKGLLQQLFPQEGELTPHLRFPEFKKSAEWAIKPLGKVAENLNSKRIPITENQRMKGDIPYIGASGIIDYVKDYIFNERLLCISEDGANLVARVYPIAFSITGKTWVNNHAHVLRFKEEYTQTYVEQYLNSINLEKYITGQAQPKLNRAKLDSIEIPFPLPEEQKKIAGCLSSLDEFIAFEIDNSNQLKALKKGLLQQLFPILPEAENE